VEALGKDYFFAEGPETALGKDTGPRQRLCRVPDKEPSAKTLFADSKFPENSLPRAALGKAFVEGFWAFAEGLRPSAKRPRPVVDGFVASLWLQLAMT